VEIGGLPSLVMERFTPKARRFPVRELWFAVLFLVVYLALQLWILPKLGVET